MRVVWEGVRTYMEKLPVRARLVECVQCSDVTAFKVKKGFDKLVILYVVFKDAYLLTIMIRAVAGLCV